MEVEDTEHGVQRLRLTEQTTFKLIWVRSILFVHWQHKDVRVAVTHGPPEVYISSQAVTWNTYKENNAERVSLLTSLSTLFKFS